MYEYRLSQLIVLMNVREAAWALNKSVATIRRWLVSGRLKGRKIGREWIIDQGDLDGG